MMDHFILASKMYTWMFFHRLILVVVTVVAAHFRQLIELNISTNKAALRILGKLSQLVSAGNTSICIGPHTPAYWS